jgi:hypothetical protein
MKKSLLFFTILIVFAAVTNAQDYSDPQNMDVNYNREAEYPGGINNFIGDLWMMMEYCKKLLTQKRR